MIKVLEERTLELKNIDIKYSQDQSDDQANFYADKVGKYPYIVFRNVPIETPDIYLIKLRNDDFLPTMEIVFLDPTNLTQDTNFPLDNDIISLFIKSTSENLKAVRMDFKILTVNMVKDSKDMKNKQIFSMTCSLDVNHLYYTPYQSFSKKSSFDVLKSLAYEFGLGWASNISNTNDIMTWINPRTTNMEFINDVVQSSYLNDSSFLWSFVDFYYNLNFVDIETQLNEDGSLNQQIVQNMTGYFDPNNKQKETTMPLFLTNHPDYQTGPNQNVYISQYNLQNSSTKTNLEAGYLNRVRYYNKEDYNLSIMTLDTISTAGKDDNLIVLKNQPQDSDGLFKYNFADKWLGKIDTDNVHKNFVWAQQQNKNNISYFQKIRMKVVLNVANFNLYRFQNIPIKIYKVGELHTDNNNLYNLNERLSGNWLITGINYIYSKKDGFSQEVNLTRRDLTAFQAASSTDGTTGIKNQ